jgi:hypothetical protein
MADLSTMAVSIISGEFNGRSPRGERGKVHVSSPGVGG